MCQSGSLQKGQPSNQPYIIIEGHKGFSLVSSITLWGPVRCGCRIKPWEPMSTALLTEVTECLTRPWAEVTTAQAHPGRSCRQIRKAVLVPRRPIWPRCATSEKEETKRIKEKCSLDFGESLGVPLRCVEGFLSVGLSGWLLFNFFSSLFF